MITRIPITTIVLVAIALSSCGQESPSVPAQTPTTSSSLPATPTFTPVPTAIPPQVGFITREGTQLMLQGRPFNEISFNKFDLFYQFVLPEVEHHGNNGVPAARDELRQLHEHGYRVVRVMASPFSVADFNNAFFDDDPQRQAEKRQLFFERFDQMLDVCDEQQIRIVASLAWFHENLADLGHQSLAEGFHNRQSVGRLKLEEYIREVVSRYRDRTTIALWEIGNEWNLAADLQMPGGVVWSNPPGDNLCPGYAGIVCSTAVPFVRDQRNNFTSDDLAAFYKDTATLIRSLDQNHLITTGSSAPRASAMHLLRSARARAPQDWRFDTEAQLKEYLILTNPDPVDVISIHYYDEGMSALGGTSGNPENLRLFKRLADEIGKPLYVGEIGAVDYTTPEGLAQLQATLPVIVELHLPLTTYWAFSDDRFGVQEFSLRYGRTDEALNLIQFANSSLNK